MYVYYIWQFGRFSWGGGGDEGGDGVGVGDGESWEMDEQIWFEMVEVEWDVDCSW